MIWQFKPSDKIYKKDNALNSLLISTYGEEVIIQVVGSQRYYVPPHESKQDMEVAQFTAPSSGHVSVYRYLHVVGKGFSRQRLSSVKLVSNPIIMSHFCVRLARGIRIAPTQGFIRYRVTLIFWISLDEWFG